MLEALQKQELNAALTEQNLSQIFDVMPSGLVLLDNKGYVTKANAVAKGMLGEPLEGELWLNLIPRAFVPQADDGHELSLPDGRKVQLSLSPLNDSRGQLIVLTDLTQTRVLQANVAKLEKLSALGKMVASLAHQVRTPLSAAMLYGSNLANKTLSEQARAQFQKKLMARLGDLETQVTDMLLFARGGETLAVQACSADEILAHLHLSCEAAALSAKVELKFDYDLSMVSLIANSNTLVSALSNIVNNAIQQSRAGSHVQVRAALIEQNIVLEIEDKAGGIPKAIQSRIFEPFFTTKQNGTGLGLAVVNSVIQAHKGSIQIHNTADGACFSIVLPVHHIQQQVANGG